MARPILIIEDDPDIAEVLRYSLEAQRFETRVAVTGKEGLAASLDKDRPPFPLRSGVEARVGAHDAPARS
jgi:DNA-binding NtrC family response regulator